MSDTRYLDWPFFEERHRQLARELEAWAAQNMSRINTAPTWTPNAATLVRSLGAGGWLRHAVGGKPHGAADVIDTRAICLIRETLARHSGLADFAFAMQGLGSGAISLQGTPEQKERYLSRVAAARPSRPSRCPSPRPAPTWPPCSAARTSRATTPSSMARRPGSPTAASPISTWCSAAPARRRARAASPPSSSMPDTPGFEIAERIDVIAPHPLARLRFDNCRVPLTQRIGEAGEGFKVAMRTLDVFRTSVAAAALGFARRAMDEALQRATTRRMFNQVLADFQLTQAKLAQMATTIDSSALLVYRAAWQRDQGQNVTREAAMAKLTATEGAQQVIDAAVQMFGGLGVVSGQMVERLYREIRSLRIYEGATEVQQLIIARELLEGR